jgi:hypothetical protein
MARKKWRCYHCDQVFTSDREARLHFGNDLYSYPACRIAIHEQHLIEYIRKLEAEVQQHRAENHEVLVAAYSMQCAARQIEPEAEQRGYDKGVRDTWAAAQAAQQNGKAEVCE